MPNYNEIAQKTFADAVKAYLQTLVKELVKTSKSEFISSPQGWNSDYPSRLRKKIRAVEEMMNDLKNNNYSADAVIAGKKSLEKIEQDYNFKEEPLASSNFRADEPGRLANVFTAINTLQNVVSRDLNDVTEIFAKYQRSLEKESLQTLQSVFLSHLAILKQQIVDEPTLAKIDSMMKQIKDDKAKGNFDDRIESYYRELSVNGLAYKSLEDTKADLVSECKYRSPQTIAKYQATTHMVRLLSNNEIPAIERMQQGMKQLDQDKDLYATRRDGPAKIFWDAINRFLTSHGRKPLQIGITGVGVAVKAQGLFKTYQPADENQPLGVVQTPKQRK